MTDQPQPSARPTRASGARAVAICAIVVGALIAAGTAASAARATAQTRSTTSTISHTADTTGITALQADMSAGDLTIRFDDVPDAQLQVSDASDPADWRLTRRGDTLRVASPSRGFGWTSGHGWFGLSWWGDWFRDDRRSAQAVLTLPETLPALRAQAEVAAGDLRIDGEFRDVDLTVDAGHARVSGSAERLRTTLNAGKVDLALADVRTADVEVSAGVFSGSFTGAAPDEVSLTTTAGSLELAVPAGDYAVTSEVTAGTFDNRIGSDPASAHRVHAEVTAGRTVLRAAD